MIYMRRQQTASPSARSQDAFLMPPAVQSLSFSDREIIACGITKAARGLTSALSHTVAPHGLTAAEASLISKLDLGLSYPGDISACMGIEPANLSRVIRSAEEKGLITREVDQRNRAKAILALTRSGRKKIAELKPAIAAMESRAMGGLSSREAAQLKELLTKLCVGLIEADYL